MAGSFSYLYMAVIVPLVITGPLFIAIYKYKYLPGPAKLFTFYLLLSGCGDLVADIVAARHLNNMPVLHIYTLLEFLLISVYYKKIFNSLAASRCINITMALFTLFHIVNSVFVQSIYSYNTYSRSLSGIIIVIYTLYYFKMTLDDTGALSRSQKIFLYINAAFLLYFGGGLFLFISSNMIISNHYLNTVIWDIHATLVLIMYTLFTIALIHVRKYR